MSGYRQSGYDSEAYQTMGRPLRPFNWLQWTGVAFEVAGVILFLVKLAEKSGWIPQWVDLPLISAVMLMIIGMSLINSRREPANDVTPQQHAANRRLLIVTVGLCAIILGAATIVTLFTGA